MQDRDPTKNYLEFGVVFTTQQVTIRTGEDAYVSSSFFHWDELKRSSHQAKVCKLQTS